MEFYKIWNTRGGLVGVNRLILRDLIGIELTVGMIYLITLALFVQFLPIIMLFWYFCHLLDEHFSGDISRVTEQRLIINILTVISVIYYMLDFHFGFFSFSISTIFMSENTLNWIAKVNLSIGLISIFLFFLGHEIYKVTPSYWGRNLVFVAVLFFGFKFINPLSNFIVLNNITQYTDSTLEAQRESDRLTKLNREEYERLNPRKTESERVESIRQEELATQKKLDESTKRYVEWINSK